MIEIVNYPKTIMEVTSKNIINVAQILAPIVSSRDVIKKLKDAAMRADAKSVDLDFRDVEFVSRSVAHELLLMRDDLKRKFFKKKDISFINTNDNVREMLRVVAANRVLSKKSKLKFTAERVNIDTLLKDIPA